MNYNASIEDLPETLRSLSDVQSFLRALLNNFETKPRDWQNNTLESFINGMMMFAFDIKGYYKNNDPTIDPEQASWRVFADILLAGRVYDSD